MHSVRVGDKLLLHRSFIAVTKSVYSLHRPKLLDHARAVLC